MPISIMGRKSLALIDQSSRCSPTRKDKTYESRLPIISFGIVAYGFVGPPFSKQLYTEGREYQNAKFKTSSTRNEERQSLRGVTIIDLAQF